MLPEADLLVVDDGSTDAPPTSRAPAGAEVVSFGQNRGLPAGIAAGYAYALAARLRPLRPGRRRRPAPVMELQRLLERVREGECDVAVGSRFASGEGFAPYRYMPSAPRRFGTALLRRAMRIVLRRPFLDATSGMYAAMRRRCRCSRSRTRPRRRRSKRSCA